jgi:endonuclease/exonuclease/phosphatase family metal-dependent hydrolase
MPNLTALVWNMGLGSPPRKRPAKNWDRLSLLMQERSVDLALLNEASVPVPEGFTARYEIEGTMGRDTRSDGTPISRPWVTAVVAAGGQPKPVNARATGSHGRRPRIPFEPARPGSWAAAVVETALGPVTCISLYGLLEELSDASVHRSLSDVSPIFSDPDYNEHVLLGGDLNTTTAWRDYGHRRRDRGILERIEAYGLVDCLKQMRKPGRLKNCACVFGHACQHTWTRLDLNEKKSRKTPHQMDYLFASLALARRLTSCEAASPLKWREYSDHSPVVATFE